MNATAIISALDLPPEARVEQRVPKKLLLENGAPTAADKRLINDGVEELQWVAALKPTTVGVPEFRDATREYLEVAVLRLATRAGAKAQRLVELVHRAVPYPVLLVVDQLERPCVSAAHKRWSQGEAGKTVLEGDVVEARCTDDATWEAFLKALSVGRQPRTTLFELYQGWLNALHAVLAASVTGAFTLPATPDAAFSRQEALRECARLEAEIVRVRTTAKKAKQISRQVELNLELKRLEAAKAKESLKL
jgi:hypothetical protein